MHDAMATLSEQADPTRHALPTLSWNLIWPPTHKLLKFTTWKATCTGCGPSTWKRNYQWCTWNP